MRPRPDHVPDRSDRARDPQPKVDYAPPGLRRRADGEGHGAEGLGPGPVNSLRRPRWVDGDARLPPNGRKSSGTWPTAMARMYADLTHYCYTYIILSPPFRAQAARIRALESMCSRETRPSTLPASLSAPQELHPWGYSFSDKIAARSLYTPGDDGEKSSGRSDVSQSAPPSSEPCRSDSTDFVSRFRVRDFGID